MRLVLDKFADRCEHVVAVSVANDLVVRVAAEDRALCARIAEIVEWVLDLMSASERAALMDHWQSKRFSFGGPLVEVVEASEMGVCEVLALGDPRGPAIGASLGPDDSLAGVTGMAGLYIRLARPVVDEMSIRPLLSLLAHELAHAVQWALGLTMDADAMEDDADRRATAWGAQPALPSTATRRSEVAS